MPEFSRIVSVGQVPEKRPVLCKLIAKPGERKGLAERFDIPDLTYFAANVTLKRSDPSTVMVLGSIEAHISYKQLIAPASTSPGEHRLLAAACVLH
jgi:hypothetical protein